MERIDVSMNVKTLIQTPGEHEAISEIKIRKRYNTKCQHISLGTSTSVSNQINVIVNEYIYIHVLTN